MAANCYYGNKKKTLGLIPQRLKKEFITILVLLR